MDNYRIKRPPTITFLGMYVDERLTRKKVFSMSAIKAASLAICPADCVDVMILTCQLWLCIPEYYLWRRIIWLR